MTSNRAKRRAEARARAQRRRNLLIATFGVLALIGASVLVFAVARRDPSSTAGDEASADAERRPEPNDARGGSAPTEGPSSFAIGAVDEYRVVYRVDDYAGGTQVTTTEEIRVRRPFDARVDRREGAPPGDDTTSTQLSRFGVLSLPAGAEGTLTLSVPPEPSATDLRFDIALDDLVRADAAARREWREIDGRRCRVHRFGEPVTTGEPVAWDGDADSYADLCVDERGILLEELWVTDGRVLRRRVAVEVDDRTAGLTDELLAIESEPLPQDQGGGSLVELDPTSAPEGDSWELGDPEGFTRRGRYGVDAPRQGAQPVASTSSLVDVWTRGHDLLLLEQGTAAPATSSAGAREVDAGDLGEGRLILGLRLNEVRVDRPNGQTVRVRGTVPAEELLDVARAVRQRTGGSGLRPIA